ncbi:MAG: FAD:protein FMN transferase [Acidobacteria bacterium]|nr:FAD:protein FMN transferase [Acidobacteriota bacterium]
MYEYQRSCEAMGTRFDVILRGSHGQDDEQHLEAVAVAIGEEVQRLDALLSRFNPSSEMARINREAKTKAVRVDRELFALLERCEIARQTTNGYFDIAAATGGAGIALDAASCSVRFTNPATQIDLGAIGKGYALDCGFEIIARFGIEHALLNGGTSSVRGLGAAWPIDLRHPLQPERIVHRLDLVNLALSCSAARHPAQTQSDVLNPLTSAPILSNDACLVLAESATEAEIYSTALLTMGKVNASQYLATLCRSNLQVKWF